MTFCNICLKSFRIDNSGISQVKSHVKRLKPGETVSVQKRFEVGKKGEVNLPKNDLVLSSEDSDSVIKACCKQEPFLFVY